MGVQGEKRKKSIGKDFCYSVDKYKYSDFKSIYEVPLKEYDTVFVCVPDKEKWTEFGWDGKTVDEILEDGRDPPISKQHIIKRLGKKGKTIFEFMMIGTKNGIIASYGRKLISFIRKIRMSTSEGFSNLKHKMIASGRAPELLKIVAFVFTATALNDFITGFEIMNMPFIGENEVIESGLGIIANGNG